MNVYTVFDAVQSPPLSSTPCEIGRILVFEKLSTNFFCKKTMPLNLLWTRSSYFCLFFLFKYNEKIIKQPSSCTFCIKVVKFQKFLKIFKNKKSPLSSPPSRIWASVGRLGGGTRQRRIRYYCRVAFLSLAIK